MKFLLCTVVLILAATNSLAQDTEPESKEEPRSGFEWLKQFEGEWETSHNGIMSSKSVGNKWIVSTLSFQGTLASVQTIGYDTKTTQYVGTWIDSTSDYLWHYVGFLDSTGRKLVLEAEGPGSSESAGSKRYRDTYEFTSENEITAASQMLNDNGEWQTFSTSKMTRATE